MDTIEGRVKFIIYKTTNLVNGKIYIGMHQTTNINDSYMGSGVAIEKAFKKYGLSSFKKEILYIFDTFEEMAQKEREIVNTEFVKRKDTYNLMVGGYGGFSYINSNGLNHGPNWKHLMYETDFPKEVGKRGGQKIKEKFLNPIYKKQMSQQIKKIWTPKKRKEFSEASIRRGYTHSIESRKKISKANKGKNYRGTGWSHSKKTKEKIRESLKNFHRESSKKESNFCTHCGINITGGRYCFQHAGKLQRMFDTPEKKEILLKEISEKSKGQVAKKYEISWESLDYFLKHNYKV